VTIGGESVYRSRAMLGIYLDETNIFYRFADNQKEEFQQQNSLVIYPNPTQDYFLLKVIGSTSEDKFQLVIEDQTGRIVLGRQVWPHNLTNVSTQGFCQGVYFLSLTNSENAFETKLIIVK
jgi:hypothetical protein